MKSTANTLRTDRTRSISTARLVTAALMAALTLLATSVLKIPTPTLGYIHIGDCFVILSGIFLGPVLGGLAAGVGSGLADLLAGYVLWIPGTFLIKFATAAVAGLLMPRLTGMGSRAGNRRRPAAAVLFSAICGELVMVTGYFLYNILMVSLAEGQANTVSLASAVALSLAEIPFNLLQGTAGIILSSALFPLLDRLPFGRLLSQ